ncbi:MAG: hypothetical protein CV087_11115 [Candidatus Brocadia sp. WS118]|nr:MAG: hypothetical protein CV087_11115 [Candidatus Brocadia sp. WS118]
MEREKKNGDLYIDSVFNDAQSWIWTADKESVSMAWSVGFRTGCCGAGSVINYSYVRAVRSWQS